MVARRPEKPGPYGDFGRATHGTGIAKGTIAEVRNVNGQRRYVVRVEGGDVQETNDALHQGPGDYAGVVGARVLLGYTDLGEMVIFGPLGEASADHVAEDHQGDPDADRGPQAGPGERVIRWNDTKIIFGANGDLTFIVPGVLREQAGGGVKSFVGGDSGERPVLFGPLAHYLEGPTTRLNELDAFAVEVAAILKVIIAAVFPVGAPVIPTYPREVPDPLGPPGGEVASGVVSLPAKTGN